MNAEVKITLGAPGPDAYRPVMFRHVRDVRSDRLAPERPFDGRLCVGRAIDRPETCDTGYSSRGYK